MCCSVIPSFWSHRNKKHIGKLRNIPKFFFYSSIKLDMELTAEICECQFCTRYRCEYDAIKHRPRWLTISPPYSHDDPDLDMKRWYAEFFKFRYFADKILGVAEFANGRLHFHFVYELKDPIKEYKTLNRLRSDCMIRCYKGYPEKGLHYLGKDVDDAVEMFKEFTPVITTRSIETYHKSLQRKRKNRDTERTVFEDWEVEA